MFKKALMILMAVGLYGVSYAEEIIEKEEVVITAEKRNTNLSKTAREVTVITAKEIEEKGATTVAEALKSMPGVYISDITGNGKSAVVDLRGQGEAAATNIAVYVNGVRQNTMDMSGSDFLTIDIEEIDRIEVMKGANSVLYGERAVGGAINIITKKIKSDKLFSGSASVRAEKDGSNKESLRLNLNTGKIKSYISGGSNRKEGYRDNSELHAYDASYYIEGSITKNNSVSLKTTYHQDRCGLPGSLKIADMEADRKKTKYPRDYSKVEIKGAEIQHIYRNNKLEVKSTLIMSERAKRYLMFDKYAGNIKGDKLNFISETSYKTENNNFLFGVDTLKEESKDSGEKTTKLAIEGYIYDFYNIAKYIEISGGARTATIEMEFTGNKSKKFNKTIFEAGTKYSYSNSGIVYGKYAMGYRMPTTDEYYDSYGGTFMDKLKPQENSDYEIGLKDYFDYIGKIESSIFYSEAKNEIYYDNDEYINKNMDSKTVRKGFEIKRECTVWNIRTYQTASYIDTEIKRSGKEIPWVPRVKATAGAVWDITDKDIFNIETIYTGRRYALSDEGNIYGKVSSNTLFNCEGKHNFGNVSLFAGIKNIMNKKYCDYILNSTGKASYYPSAERVLYMGVTYKF